MMRNNALYRFLAASIGSTQTTRSRGFTFIELLITLSVIAISFLPLLQLYAGALEQVELTDNLTTARFLAQEGMERMKNSVATKAQLKRLGDVWEPPLLKPPRMLNGKRWRILRRVETQRDPPAVHVEVYRDENLRTGLLEQRPKPVLALVMLFEDFDWSLAE